MTENILLIHNNKILEKEDSIFDNINKDVTVIIIENKYYPDNSYYISLKNKYPNTTSMNIIFSFYSKNYSMTCPKYTSLCEMIKAFILRLGNCQTVFIYNGKELNQYDKRKISEILNDVANIICITERKKISYHIIGKELKGRDINNGRGIKIGTLNSTKLLFSQNLFGNKVKKKLKKIIIGNIIIKEEDDLSLLSLGIKEDFICILEYENKSNI